MTKPVTLFYFGCEGVIWHWNLLELSPPERLRHQFQAPSFLRRFLSNTQEHVHQIEQGKMRLDDIYFWYSF